MILIVLITPSIVNPGPTPSNRPLKIFYNNVQGFINTRDLNSNTPDLNMTKIHEFHKPDIIILNETWVKKSILDTEVLPERTYIVLRTDRSGKTHPWDPCNPKKFRRNGGVLIAHRRDIDIESTQVGLIKVQAEILTVNFKLSTGNKFSISTLRY